MADVWTICPRCYWSGRVARGADGKVRCRGCAWVLFVNPFGY